MPGSNSCPIVSEGYEVPLSYWGDLCTMNFKKILNASRPSDCFAPQSYGSEKKVIETLFLKKNLNAPRPSELMTTRQHFYFGSLLFRRSENLGKTKALHGRLAGRFKPPLAGRCNDFAPSRQKNATAKNNRPVPALEKNKKKHRPVPSRRKKKKKPPRPTSEKKNPAPSLLGKKQQPPRPASKKKQTAPSRREQQNTPPRGWKLETDTTACLFFSLSCCTFISYCSLVRSIF